MWRLCGVRHFSCTAARRGDSATHYAILGVGFSATAAEIKTAFYQLSKQYHPDRVRNKTDLEQKQSREKFEQVSTAYSVLSDPAQRRDYDQQNSYRCNSGSSGGNTQGNPNTGSGFHSSGMFRDRPASGFNRRADKTRTSFQGGFRTSRMKANTASSRFTGEFREASNYDVPHFDYDKHHHQQCSYEEHRVRHQKHQLEEEYKRSRHDNRQYHSYGARRGINVGAMAGIGATGVVLIAMMSR